MSRETPVLVSHLPELRIQTSLSLRERAVHHPVCDLNQQFAHRDPSQPSACPSLTTSPSWTQTSTALTQPNPNKLT